MPFKSGQFSLEILTRGTTYHAWKAEVWGDHYNDVIMSTMVSQITSLTIVYTTAYQGPDQRKHQRSTSLAFVRGIYQWPVNSPHKGPVMRKMFPFDDVIMLLWVLKSCLSSDSVIAVHIDGLVQKRRNSSATALELRLSCINPLICNVMIYWILLEQHLTL